MFSSNTVVAPVAAIASTTLHGEEENIHNRLGSRVEAPIAMSNEREASAAENGGNRLQMIGRIDFSIGRLVHSQRPMNVKEVSKESIIAARKGLGQRLVHIQIVFFIRCV